MTKNPADLQAGLESDDNLMARVGKGDAGAFETLYGRWSRRVMAYAFRALSDKGEEEESRFPSDTEGDWTHFEERERLHAALETLPFPQRNALLLAVTGGLSYREIALQEGISEDAVAARICRARKALRKALAASGCEEEEKVDA